MSKKRSSLFLGGLVLGAAVGGATGLLLARWNAERVRRVARKSAAALPELAEDLSSSMELQAERFVNVARLYWRDARLRFQEAIAAGVDASRAEWQAEQNPQQTTQRHQNSQEPTPSSGEENSAS